MHRRKVLLIGRDAADWEHTNPLLEEGLMPTIDALINWEDMGNLESYPTLSSVALKLGPN